MAFTRFERDRNAVTGVMWHDFVTAVGMMVYTNEEGEKKPTVAGLALAFNTTPELVREAVAEHHWLYSPQHDDPAQQIIESEGE